ncbi:MAG: hypothetical protein FJY98_02360 [Candidatus Liptonbacteria bacterium]|nr:hypothetical protein [Candidatus Liptonbacteria bacterium]
MDKIQIAKEKAMKLAAAKGLALQRVEKRIYAVDRVLKYYFVSESDSFDSLWEDASQALEKGDLKVCKKETPQTERDKLREAAIELGISKKGLALFHRGNELWGYDKEGKSYMILAIEEDVIPDERPSEEIWMRALEILQI